MNTNFSFIMSLKNPFMIKKIKLVTKKFLNWKLYLGSNKIEYIGNNVTPPYNIRISGETVRKL